jgi:hypothetical protein
MADRTLTTILAAAVIVGLGISADRQATAAPEWFMLSTSVGCQSISAVSVEAGGPPVSTPEQMRQHMLGSSSVTIGPMGLIPNPHHYDVKYFSIRFSNGSGTTLYFFPRQDECEDTVRYLRQHGYTQ